MAGHEDVGAEIIEALLVDVLQRDLDSLNDAAVHGGIRFAPAHSDAGETGQIGKGNVGVDLGNADEHALGIVNSLDLLLGADVAEAAPLIVQDLNPGVVFDLLRDLRAVITVEDFFGHLIAVDQVGHGRNGDFGDPTLEVVDGGAGHVVGAVHRALNQLELRTHDAAIGVVEGDLAVGVVLDQLHEAVGVDGFDVGGGICRCENDGDTVEAGHVILAFGRGGRFFRFGRFSGLLCFCEFFGLGRLFRFSLIGLCSAGCEREQHQRSKK